MQDALAEVLSSVRLKSAVFCRADVSAPWAVSTQGANGGIFHAVLRGRCVALGAGQTVELSAGDVLLLPHGAGHTLADRPETPPVPIRGLIRESDDGGVPALCSGGGGERAQLICGRFDFDRTAPHPLLGLLPPLIHLRSDDPNLAPWLTPTVQFLASELERREPGAATIITRLTDVLVVHAVRACIQPGVGGWLSALKEPRIGRALSLLHSRPQEAWTAERLANEVAMSRSAFFELFSRLVGEPPAQYLLRWRMHLAARSLRDGPASIAEVAETVGYASEAAFSKAFKRLVGQPPSDYRRGAAS